MGPPLPKGGHIFDHPPSSGSPAHSRDEVDRFEPFLLGSERPQTTFVLKGALNMEKDHICYSLCADWGQEESIKPQGEKHGIESFCSPFPATSVSVLPSCARLFGAKRGVPGTHSGGSKLTIWRSFAKGSRLPPVSRPRGVRSDGL